MHGGTQERWKHSVPGVKAVDLWRDGEGTGWKERINVSVWETIVLHNLGLDLLVRLTD